MPLTKRKSVAKRGGQRKKRAMRKRAYRKRPGIITTNTASVRENYTSSIADGSLIFFSLGLSNATFDMAQQVAEAYQEYRVKYIKITFRPSADTYPIAAGNSIPQLYFAMNKAQSIPTSADLQTLLDMGTRPIRFDDKNIVKVWKPTVLVGTDTNPGFITNAQAIKTTPWLSTNADAQNPGGLWNPSNVEHLGCVFVVTKPNPATPTINYFIDVETVFQFRKRNAPGASTPPAQPSYFLNGSQLRPVLDLSGNQVV